MRAIDRARDYGRYACRAQFTRHVHRLEQKFAPRNTQAPHFLMRVGGRIIREPRRIRELADRFRVAMLTSAELTPCTSAVPACARGASRMNNF